MDAVLKWLNDNQGAIYGVSAAVLVLVVYLQLRLGRRSMKQDHERRKKQATLDFYAQVMKNVDSDRRTISAKYGQGKISTAEARKLYDAASSLDGPKQEDHEDYVEVGVAIRNYLNALEWVAVGVALGIHDEDVLKRLAFARFNEHVLKQFPDYIAELRKGSSKPYGEALFLADAWKDKPPDPGRGGPGAIELGLLRRISAWLAKFFDRHARA